MDGVTLSLSNSYDEKSRIYNPYDPVINYVLRLSLLAFRNCWQLGSDFLKSVIEV